MVRSRSGANLAARFPEVLSAVLALTRGRGGGVVHDGEVVALREGRLDFPALSYGPARRAREGVEVRYVAFDVLAADGADLRDRPYTVRRAQLVELLDRAAGAEPSVVDLVPASDHREAALSWMAPHWSALGIKGIVAWKGEIKVKVTHLDSENFEDLKFDIKSIHGHYKQLCYKLGTKPVWGKNVMPPSAQPAQPEKSAVPVANGISDSRR